jgi:LysM repeat protein
VVRHAAPPREGVASLRVPKGSAEVILAKLADGAELPAFNLTVQHRVRRGETVQAIANQYHVSATALAKRNGISRTRPLKRGMVLTVPASLAPPAPAELEPSDPRASTAYVPDRERRLPVSLNADSDAEGRLTVTVKRGETLGQIAARHGVTVEDLRRWNHLKTASVRRGTRLKIRTAEAAQRAAVSSAADSATVAALAPPTPRRAKASAATVARIPARATVVVRAGDTLSTLAERHGTTVTRLKRANGLSTSRIRVGQRLRIPA